MRKSVWPGLRCFWLMAVMLAVAGCSDGSITVTNSPPSAVIEAPSVGTEVLEGAVVSFRGAVEDRSTVSAEIIVTWSSSLDGELMSGNADSEGITEFATAELSAGTHTITLQARDAGGASGEDILELLVRADAAPSISIVTPTADGVYYSDLPVTLQASVNDAEDLPEDLRVSWAVDGGETLATDLSPDSTGLSTTNSALASGTYLLIATATDTAERTATATVTIVVGPPNTAPTCEITAPASLSTAPIGALVLLEGTVADPDVPADWLSASFASNVDGALGTVLPTTAGEVVLPTTVLSAATHNITMTVLDEVGGTCTDAVILTVSNPPTAIITTPSAGEIYNDSDTIELTGTVHDLEDADNNLLAEWASDLGGSLGFSIPDSAGSVALNVTGLTPGTHLLSLTATDSVGLTGTATVTISVNASPTAPVVSLLPTLPATTDDLSVSIDTPSVDPDGGPLPITYDYSWTLNGNPMPALSGLTTIPAAETVALDTWAIYVTASDGQATSQPGSAAVAIGNSIPSITSATVTPSVGLDADTFTVTPSGWFDLDGGTPGYQYQWYADTTPIAGATSDTLVPLGQPAGTPIWCEVTPDDGQSIGLPVNSNLVAINTPPGVAGVVISPPSAVETTILTASYGLTTDVDGQPVTVSWQWNLDGNPIAGATTSTLDGGSFDRGNAITVTGTANDGLEDGLPVTSTAVVIANSVPSISGLSITPSSGTETTTFTCTPSGWSDPDPADTAGYIWEWSVSGNPSVTTQTITGASFDRGDLLTCTATPTDGTDLGSSLTSSPVTVGNTAPSITSVTITPGSGTETTTFTCSPSGWSDPDPADTASYTWQWSVGGSPSVTTQTITGASFDKGDVLTCTATPTDGTDFGIPLTSSGVTVDNAAPSITAVVITPSSGGEATTFTCSPSGWSDPDPGDSPGYTWQWTITGSPSVTTQSITGASFDKGDVLACTATPTDGTASGTAVTSASVTVGNTAPSITSVAISPPTATEGSTLSCDPSGWSDSDPGDSPGYTWQWYVGINAVATTQTINGTLFNTGDQLYCEVTPTDGTDSGTSVASTIITVGNTAPSITSVAINPGAGTEATTFTCIPSGWSDPDPGDIPGYTWQWSVTGSPSVTTQSITGASFDKGDVLACTATPTDGTTAGSAVTSSGVTVDNTAPLITSVAINPGSGTETTTFTCTPSGWSDPDPADTAGYTWQWSVGSTASVTTQTITGLSFNSGDVLACTATPTDGTTAGAAVTSSGVTVGNTAPSITSVAISPTSGGEATTFTCSPSGWSDPDPGDSAGYTWQWTISGTASVTTQSITGASFDRGDVLACTATPTDGTSPGAAVTSSSVTVGNTAPSITSVAINPGSGSEATTFSCSPSGWSDPDPGDSPGYTWQWSVGSTASVTTQTITGLSFNSGDVLACTATPTDGTTAGAAVTSSGVTVGNTAPSITSVAISPTSGGEATTFTCSPSGWSDPDPGDTAGYTWQWSVGGTASVTTQTITGLSFNSGDVLACTATPTDGTTTGAAVTSSGVTVGNTAPSITSVAISPSIAYTNTTLTATPSGWADADGDTISYTYAWYVANALVAETSSAINCTTYCDKGQAVYVVATPSDGTDTGTAVASSSVTLLNSAPTTPTISIDPTAPEAGIDDLICLIDTASTDDDGDTITYTISWTSDYVAWTGSTYTTYETDDTLSGTDMEAGVRYECVVSASDGSVSTSNVRVDVTPTTASITHPGGGDMLQISAGSFDMGCTTAQQADGNCGTDESPVHTVTLTHDFYMGETEVTQAEYIAIMGTNPSYYSSCGTGCPVDYVTWHDVAEYANALSVADGLTECFTCTSGSCTTPNSPYTCDGYRLPTEAEWEYAARAGTGYVYAGSDTVGDVAWYSSNASSKTHPVAQKLPNDWGLYDMSGNVYEWTWDWYDSSYYSSSPSSDPEGPTSASYRVYRGGGWFNDASRARVANRDWSTPSLRYYDIGFRLARTAKLPITHPGGGDMIYITVGTFGMGCTTAQQADGNCRSNESPVHSVTLTNDFYMGETEVTQAEYQAITGNSPSYNSNCGTDCPVESISWHEMAEYANALSVLDGLTECFTCANGSCSSANSPYTCDGYRLPTEAEWEYAARAGTGYVYAGSDTVGDVAWYNSNASSKTHPVAQKLPNDWGLYDMSGNVYEWTWDWYDSSYYSSSPSSDPEGPTSGSYPVVRGGSIRSGASGTRVAVRHGDHPSGRDRYMGFRLSRTANP